MKLPIALLAAVLLGFASLHAQVPPLLSYQGRVAVEGVIFDGDGLFKFALVDGDGSTVFWTNDGSSEASGEPLAAVTLPVSKGLYSVLLGDVEVANMTSIPTSVFDNPDVRLRVWFNDGTTGWQQVTPDQRLAAVAYAARAEKVVDGSIGPAQLAAGAVAANLEASGMSGVPTSSILLSRDAGDADLASAGYLRIGKVSQGPSWSAGNTASAPTARAEHTAVWTGAEMIVWGGLTDPNTATATGARYNPAANSWSPVATTGAPSARRAHTAVWTGNTMIVWGGHVPNLGYPGSGASYDPTTNAWAPVNTDDAPENGFRGFHTAVWTGEEMIVWGGDGPGTAKFTGGRYNPDTDTWITFGADVEEFPPSQNTTLVWTGAHLLIWGGSQGLSQLGGRFELATGQWTPMSQENEPVPRDSPSVIWTGTEAIYWGGEETGAGTASLNSGGRYNPTTDSWSPLSSSGMNARDGHSAVWTGDEMIVWGGREAATDTPFGDGARYDPATDTWTPVDITDGPASRWNHSALWTGDEMMVWGGQSPGDSYFSDILRYLPEPELYLYQKL